MAAILPDLTWKDQAPFVWIVSKATFHVVLPLHLLGGEKKTAQKSCVLCLAFSQTQKKLLRLLFSKSGEENNTEQLRENISACRSFSPSQIWKRNIEVWKQVFNAEKYYIRIPGSKEIKNLVILSWRSGANLLCSKDIPKHLQGQFRWKLTWTGHFTTPL